MINNPRASRNPERPAPVRVGEQRVDLPGQGGWVLGGDQNPHSLEHGVALYPGGDDSRATCHGLEQNKSHSVVAGGNHDGVGRAEIRCGIGAEASQFHPVFQVQDADLLLDHGAVLTIADEPQTDRGRTHQGESGHGDIRCPLMAQAADTDHKRVGRPARDRSMRAKPGDVDPVGVDHDSIGPRAESHPAIRTFLLRDGHHS